MTLHTVFFSGKGTTAACAHCIKNAMGLQNKTYDWLQKPPTADIDIAAEDACKMEHDISDESLAAIKRFVESE